MRTLLLCLVLIATAPFGGSGAAAASLPDGPHCAEMHAVDAGCDAGEHGCSQCPASSAIQAQPATPPFPAQAWQAIGADARIPHASVAPPLPPPISRKA